MEGEARAFKKPLGLGVSQGPRPMTSDTGAYVNDATGDAEVSTCTNNGGGGERVDNDDGF